MEARLLSVALVAAALLSCGANYRSENFIVHSSSSDQIAREVCAAAEKYRRDLAIEWLGQELPPWREPCPINLSRVRPGELASGKTSFYFYPSGEPHGWDMEVNGTRERVLDSVLPHEITHTIFATHFGCALPRWADEGGSTTVEHASERAKQEANLIRFLKGSKGIAFSTMFRMTEYPPEMLPLYAQGYSLTRFLILQGGEQGKRKFVTFVGEGMQRKNWTKVVSQHYGFKSLQELQDAWVEWVKQGSPDVAPARKREEGLALGAPAPAPRDAEPASAFPAQVAGGTRGVEDLSAIQSSQIPPRPSTFAAAPQRKESPTAPEQNLARPTTTGWYARQKDKPQGERVPAERLPAERVPTKPAAKEFPSENTLQPVRTAPEATEPVREAGDTRPPLPGRKLLMEWSRTPRNLEEPAQPAFKNAAPIYASDERNNSLVASGTLAR